ncbi:hypothetical protein [Streptomyces sp. NBC_01190]|uniref:hypothetical protein n=1 Tax=Streptomyces sp. NBC_01190 TaxID=2903767 RepID=UPI003864E113|nr:ABC transporter permease [Streptomyces sp. NBC_01190]
MHELNRADGVSGANGTGEAGEVNGADTADNTTTRRLLVLTVAASILSCLFVLSYGYALHAPSPHRIRVDVVAPPSTTAQVRGQLEKTAHGGFDVRARSTEHQARADILDTSASGALVVPSSGPARVLTAGAGGVSLQQVVSGGLGGAARMLDRPVRAVDEAPLPAGDRAGQSSFGYEIGLVVPGVAGSIGLYLFGRRIRLWFRVAAALGYAVLSAALGVFMMDGVLGALTGSPWALIATGAAASMVFLLTMAAVHALFGLPGTTLGAAALVIVGNAANGSTVPVPMLPNVYRQVSPWLPNGAAIRSFRDVTYFAGHGLTQPLLALALWALGALTVISLADLLHLRQKRHSGLPPAQIHATPALIHLRRRHAARRSGARIPGRAGR